MQVAIKLTHRVKISSKCSSLLTSKVAMSQGFLPGRISNQEISLKGTIRDREMHQLEDTSNRAHKILISITKTSGRGLLLHIRHSLIEAMIKRLVAALTSKNKITKLAIKEVIKGR